MGVEYKVVSHLFLGLHLKYLQHDYEAVLHKADGTTSTLKCDSSFVTSLGLRYLF